MGGKLLAALIINCTSMPDDGAFELLLSSLAFSSGLASLASLASSGSPWRLGRSPSPSAPSFTIDVSTTGMPSVDESCDR